MPLGGGEAGGMVWNEDGLTVQLQRNDARPDYLSAGRLCLPFVGDLPQFSRAHGWLDLANAQWNLVCGTAHIRCQFLKGTDLLLIEGTGLEPGRSLEARVELWNSSPDWFFRRSTDGNQPREGSSFPLERDPSAFAEAGVAGVWELFRDRPIRRGYWGDSGFIGQPPRGSALAIRSEPGGTATSRDDSASLHFGASESGSFRLFCLVASHGSANPQEDIRSRLGKWTQPGTVETALEKHTAWWENYWRRSFVSFHSTGGEADYLERLYDVFQYCLAASTADLPPCPGGGTTSIFKFNRDWHEWGTTFYHWNTRNLYFSTLAAGHFDLRKPYIDLYLKRLDSWKEAARANGGEGIIVPEITYAGDHNAAQSLDTGTFVRGIITNSLELCKEMHESWRFSPEDYPLESLYPFFRETAKFWLSRKVLGEDGRYHFLNATAGETFVHVDDPMPILAGLREVIPMVLEAAERLGQDPELCDDLRDLLAKLPDFPWDDERQKMASVSDEPSARRLGKVRNVENREFDALFPYDQGGGGGPKSAVWELSHARRLFDSVWTWHTDTLVAARLGLADWHGGEGMVSLLARSIERFQRYPCGLGNFDFTAEGDDLDMPGMEWLGLTATLAQQLVLQERAGVLEVFPCLPLSHGWEGAFCLHGPGGFRIASRIERSGRVLGIALESPRGGSTILKNPWPGERVQILGDGASLAIEQNRLFCSLESGTRCLLVPSDQEVPDIDSWFVAPNYPVDSPLRLGRSVLGIPRDEVDLPDLALRSGEACWARPGCLRVSIEVHNEGGAPSVPTHLAVAGDGGDGDLETSSTGTVPALPPGGSWQLELEVKTAHELHTCADVRLLRVEIDPFHEHADACRTNQRLRIPIPLPLPD